MEIHGYIKDVWKRRRYIDLKETEGEFIDSGELVKFKKYEMIFKLNYTIYKVKFDELRGVYKGPIKIEMEER